MLNDYLSLLGLLAGLLGFAVPLASLFRQHWHSDAVKSNPWVYYVLGFNLVLTTALPISLALEFGTAAAGTVHKTLPFYIRHYPHIVVFPALLFGFAGLFTLRAATLRWKLNRRGVIHRVAVAALVASFAMYYEATGGYLMLFEFNKEAQTAGKQFESPAVRQEIARAGLQGAFTEPMALQYDQALRAGRGDHPIAGLLASYDKWDGLDEDWRSKSRLAYLCMFWYMLFVMALSFALLSASRHRVSAAEDKHISMNLAGALAVYLLWMPFRIYYNHQTKSRVFGPDWADNFFGPLPRLEWSGLSAPEIAPMVAIIVFIYFLLLRASDLSRQAAVLSVGALTAAVVIASAVLATRAPQAFSALYGLHGEIRFIVLRIVVLFLLVLLTYDFLSSRVDPPGDTAARTEG